MKIAMIGHKRIPSREGGVEIVVEELSRRLVSLGNTVTCYNRKSKHIAGQQFDDTQRPKMINGIRIKWVPTPNDKRLNAIIYSFLSTIDASFKDFDIIHFHAEGPSSMLPIAKIMGKKTVVTIHGLDWQRAKWGSFATKYLLFGEKTAAKYADEIIVLSQNMQKYFDSTYSRKTIYIPNGITPIEKCNDDIINEKYGIKKDEFFLFLGRIVPEKGLDCLIDAYLSSNTDKKLVIAGSASHSSEYYNSLKEKVTGNDNIIFTDFVQGEELGSLFSNCYAYILPSQLEGMPISLLEAMSCSCCCITSDIPECLNVTGKRALHFKVDDAGELSQIISTLSADKTIVETYRKISRAYVMENFNWDDITTQTLNVYNRLLGNSK